MERNEHCQQSKVMTYNLEQDIERTVRAYSAHGRHQVVIVVNRHSVDVRVEQDPKNYTNIQISPSLCGLTNPEELAETIAQLLTTKEVFFERKRTTA